MSKMQSNRLSLPLEAILGLRRSSFLGESLELDAGLRGLTQGDPAQAELTRGELAMVLAMGLLDDLCARVPLAAAYVSECTAGERRFVFDHGALRTIAARSGGLPPGRQAVARLLEPLGYRHTHTYPLERLGMTGYAYTHVDHPETIPQYFVSELEPWHFSAPFQHGVERLAATSVECVPDWAKDLLGEVEAKGRLDSARGTRLLSLLLTCFARHHRAPTLAEYRLFAKESAEMAWISTEGHTFNHITDRVVDVDAVAAVQRQLGRPIKDVVETSRSGRVRQTALRAAEVERIFLCDEGYVAQRVPGSFLEFISRDRLDSGQLDLAFDGGNAQGIFKMTDRRSSVAQ